MIRYKEIQEALLNLVGWRDGWGETKIEAINSYNPLESKSGLYFQDAHPLLTLDNLMQTMPEGWEQDGKNSFSAYLKYITEKEINNLIQNFIRIKQLNQETKDVLEERVLFYGAANRRSITKTHDELVGFMFSPTQSTGVNMRIEKIGFQFTPEIVNSDKPFTLYLGMVGEIEPQYILQLDRSKLNDNSSPSWIAISEFSVNGNKAGTVTELTIKGSPDTSQWALYYDAAEQTKIGAAPLNIGRDWSKSPCTCNRQHYMNFVEISKYLKTYPFRSDYVGTIEVGEKELNGQVPYADSLRPDYYNNFGLNIQFSMGCDITDLIIRQKSLFASALQKQMAADMLREMAMNPAVRVNRNQVNVSRMEILYETDGNGTVPGGINYELDKTLKALDFDTKGLDRVCLQCKNKGVRYGSV